MSSIETLLDLLNLTSGDAVSIAVGAVLSPAKLMALVYGLYKIFSPNYADRSWKQFVEEQGIDDGE